jgi:hypothetical protein
MEGTESPPFGGGNLGGQDHPEDEDLTGGFAQADDLEGYEDDARGAAAADDVTVPDAGPSSRAAAQPLVFRRQRNAQPAQPFQRLSRAKASKFHPKNLAPQQHTRFKVRPRDAPRSQSELQALQEEELRHSYVQLAGEQQQLGRLRLQQDQRPSLSDPTGGLPASPLCLLDAAAVTARGPVGSAGVTPRGCTSQHSGPLAPSGGHLLPPAAADALDTLSEPLAQVRRPLAAIAAAAAAAAGARTGSMTSQASSREALIEQLLQQLAVPVQQEQLQPVSALQLHSEWQQLLHESNLTAGTRQQRPAAAAEPGLSLSAAMGMPRVSPFEQSLDVSLLHLGQHLQSQLQPRQQLMQPAELLHSGSQLDVLFARHVQGSHTQQQQQQQQRGHLAGLLAGSPRAGGDSMARLAQPLAPQPQHQQHTQASQELQQQLQAQRQLQAAQLQELQHLTQDLGASLPPQQQHLATLGSLGLSFSGAPTSSGPSSSSAASMQHRLELLLRQHSSSVCLPQQQPDQGLPASRPAGTTPAPGTSAHDAAAAAAGSERDARAARQKAGIGVVRGLLVELCRDLAPAAAKEVQAIIVQQAKQAAAAAARAGRPFTATDAVRVMVQSRQAVAPALGRSGSTSSLNRLDSGMLASLTGGSFSSQRSNSTTYPGAAAAAAGAGAASVSGQLWQQQLLYFQQQLQQPQLQQLQQPQRHTPTPTAAAAAAGPCFGDVVMTEQASARKSPAAAAAAAAAAAEAADMSESSAVASCDAAMGSGEAAASGEATSGSDGRVTDPGEAPAAAAAAAAPAAAAAAAEATAAPAAAPAAVGAAEARADAPGITPPP